MKKFHDKTLKNRISREEKVRNLINFAEEKVGKEVFKAEDSVLVGKIGLKSSKMEKFLG